MDQFAREFEQWSERHAASEANLKHEIGHRLAVAGVPFDALDAEAWRVLRHLLETRKH